MADNKRTLIIGGGIAGLAVVLFLAFGVFGVHTLFIDDEVDEANPFAPAETADEQQPETDDEEQTEVTATDPPSGDASDVSDDGTADDGTDDGTADDGEADTTGTPEIITLAAGVFVDGDHPTSGDALVITDGSEQRFLRFENFRGDNGPDLNVYLRSSVDPDDFIDLGDLKGNIGDQNYELPVDVDLSEFNVVDIWCVRFGVSFGTADLAT